MKLKNICILVLITMAITSYGSVEDGFKKLIDRLDDKNPKCFQSDEEYVTLLFQKIFGHNPTPEMEVILTSLLNSDDLLGMPTVSRSDILAMLLAKKYNSSELSNKILEKEISLLEDMNLCEKVLTTPLQRSELKIDEWESFDEEKIKRHQLRLARHDENYQIYYGYMHAHTGYSDGEGTPEDAYKMARDEAHLDFLGVTDHDVSVSIWPWNNEWKKSLKIADQYNEPGRFVAIRGFEWSSPVYGHISVLNSKKLTNCLIRPTTRSLYRWLTRSGDSVVARYNHPGRTSFLGYGNRFEFNQFEIYPKAIKYMVGMELFNGRSGLRKYYYNTGYNGDKNFFDTANLNGWMVGAIGGQDNHSRNWGLLSNHRVGVYAKALTRKDIIEAYLERRTFATEDKNLKLSFKLNGAQMGSRLPAGIMKIQMSVIDADNENITEFHLYKNGDLLEKIVPEDNQAFYELEAISGDYYYVIAQQMDGDLAISSPIWIK